MRSRRPPPFALVLSALVAAAGLALILVNQTPSPTPPNRPESPTPGAGPGHACLTTRAAARVTVRSAIVINAVAQAPVKVTEQASGPRGTATVSRSEVLTARIRADQPVALTRTATARARACANAGSPTAARGAALRRAYATALSEAHAEAGRSAASGLKDLMRRLYPSVLNQARTSAAARGRQLALAAQGALAAQAQAEARTRAGT